MQACVAGEKSVIERFRQSATRGPLKRMMPRSAPPGAEAAAEVRRLLREAPGEARAAFGLRYGSDGEAVAFRMPVATILAVKEEA